MGRSVVVGAGRARPIATLASGTPRNSVKKISYGGGKLDQPALRADAAIVVIAVLYVVGMLIGRQRASNWRQNAMFRRYRRKGNRYMTAVNTRQGGGWKPDTQRAQTFKGG